MHAQTIPISLFQNMYDEDLSLLSLDSTELALVQLPEQRSIVHPQIYDASVTVLHIFHLSCTITSIGLAVGTFPRGSQPGIPLSYRRCLQAITAPGISSSTFIFVSSGLLSHM